MDKFILVIALLFTSVHAQTLDPLKDYRIGTSVTRNADGSIKRSSKVLSAFQKLHPCPSTGLTTGNCPDWQMNHSVPLACGGVDAVYNLTWIPNKIKTCKDNWCVDRYERLTNQTTVPDTANCINKMPIKFP